LNTYKIILDLQNESEKIMLVGINYNGIDIEVSLVSMSCVQM